MLIGVVGKPNCGKSTFFSASTLVDAQIANFPFTTIDPNKGTSYVRIKCVHHDLGKECQPMNSKCVNGERLIPIQLMDVAGLVPGAHEGKGLGNQFLGDLTSAKALIHVIDASGGTDAEGKIVERGSHDPCEDVGFLEKEISYWIKGILTKNWDKISKQASMDAKGPAEALANQLSGLGITEEDAKDVVKEFPEKPKDWSEENLLEFSEKIRLKSKPILIAANKMDADKAKENYEKLKKEFPEYEIIPCCAEAELALRKAEKAGLISYIPGDKEFRELKELEEKQSKALKFIKSNILEKFGGTGIQEAINKTAFELLDLIVVYPVQDQNKWTSGKGHILPDAFLVKRGAKVIDLAGTIHTDFVERFIGGVDCRTGKKIGRETELKNNDVIKIILKN